MTKQIPCFKSELKYCTTMYVLCLCSTGFKSQGAFKRSLSQSLRETGGKKKEQKRFSDSDVVLNLKELHLYH